MPFTKVGKNKNVSPSGRVFTDKQVKLYYATDGFKNMDEEMKPINKDIKPKMKKKDLVEYIKFKKEGGYKKYRKSDLLGESRRGKYDFPRFTNELQGPEVKMLIKYLEKIRERIGEQIFTLSNSKEIEPVFSVNSGSEFTIKIHGNKTTGYLWSLDTQFLETEHVSPLNLIEGENTTEDYIVNNHDEGVVGVGGVYEFRFKIAENFKGKTILNFMNKRPWEKEAIQTETAVIDVY